MESTPQVAPKKKIVKKILFGLVLALVPFLIWGIHRYLQNQKLRNRPMGLEARVFRPLPLGSVMPKGWLLEQMKLQASGLSGHLDEFWPDVMDSGWIGGKAEGWERLPYWLDGLVPLAFLTGDEKLQRKVHRVMDYILKHQSPDGWLGPEKSPPASGLLNARPPEIRDPWPQFVILKTMAQYEEATQDKRILLAMRSDLSALSLQLDQRRLFAWNFFRWGDLLTGIFWVYERTHEPWLLELAFKAANQGYNWPGHFSNLPVKEKSPEWNWPGHVVNNAMGLKTPAMLYLMTGDPRFKKSYREALRVLDRYHGEANGLFSGDECLAGKSPSQGTELCAVVEMMYSLETNLSIFGDVETADRLEKVAFNALPAAFTPDHWLHQYVQQANQVQCSLEPRPVYATVNGEAGLFGLEPHYGCCTANLHQGWPKFASHLWMSTKDGGLAAIAYAPSRVTAPVAGGEATIELTTDYPFSGDLAFTVIVPKPQTFPLYLRIPDWAKEASLTLPDGSVIKPAKGSFHKIERLWTGSEILRLRLPMPLRARRGFQNSVSLERGPLVFSLGMTEIWKPLRPFPYQTKDKKRFDCEVYTESAWNYALGIDPKAPEKFLEVQEGPLKGNPFSQEGVPVRLKAKGRKLAGWRLEQGAAQPPPISPVESTSPLEDLTLVPYGSTRLRVTEFPLLK